MKRFVAYLNGGNHINTRADTMELIDNMLHVKDGNNLVAVVDLSAVMAAHLSEKNPDELKTKK